MPATITHPTITQPRGATPSVRVAPERTRRASGGEPPERPPRGGGGGGGGGGNGGEAAAGGGMEGLGPFALALTLTGITTLFGVLIAVWLLLRRPAPDWNALRRAGALEALWVSTACLIASSAAVECAARVARRGIRARRAALAWHAGGLCLGLAFLGAQGWLWIGLARAGLVPSSGGHAAVLYSLTGLHALHVLGGLGFLTALMLRVAHAKARLPGLRLGAVYWHYLGALWLVLFALLYFVR